VKFKVDENLSGKVVALLRSAGHDTTTAVKEGLAGSSDRILAVHARAEERAIVSLDRDFCNLRAYPPGRYPGIIVLRPRTQGRTGQLTLVRAVLALLTTESLPGNLWVAEPDRVHIVRGAER
jgi:predicted nuclease of predicted toxin-antitoxin system